MNQAPEIVIAAGTRLVALSEIPKRMARAIHPDKSDLPWVLKEIGKAFPSADGDFTGRAQPFSAEDSQLLTELLGAVPRAGQEFTKAVWEAYIAPLEHSPRRPAWTMIPLFFNPGLEADILRADAETQHEDALKAAIRAGSIVPLSHALLPLDASIREALDLGQVTVETFSDYAAKFGILVKIGGSTERAATKPRNGSAEISTLSKQPEWAAQAQAIVMGHGKVERAYYLSQRDLCEHAEKVMREKGINGANGKPLDWQTIKKEAIQGEWWRANFPERAGKNSRRNRGERGKPSRGSSQS